MLQFPAPALLVKAGRRKWEKFLHAHRLWRPQTAESRLGLFAKAQSFCGGLALTKAKSLQAESLCKVLLALEMQLRIYRRRIEELFAQHPDHDLFGSLPGAGDKLAPRLLAEIGQERERFEDASAMQSYAGTAPVTVRSGQVTKHRFRRGANTTLRAAVHLWADLSRKTCTWAQTYYQAHRAKGQSHACALRCLGQCWLNILWKMWQTRTPYDEALHTRNQAKHGSWVLQFKPA